MDNKLSELSKEQVNSMKGIFSVMVLVHHLFQSTAIISNRYLGALFQAVGFLAVSVFFFLSGYGLQVSYSIKKQAYMKSFFKEKIMPFYLVILLLLVIYLPARICMGEAVAPLKFFRSFFFGATIISKGWYLQVQLFLYLLFFYIWRSNKNDSNKQLVLLAVVIVHIALCIIFDVSITRYISLLAFNLGIFWADKKEFVYAKLEKKKVYILSLVVSFVLMGSTFGIWQFTDGSLSVFSQGICQLFFVTFIVLVVHKIEIVNSITTHLGDYSFEVYIIQGLFLNLYKSPLLYIHNDYLFVGVVVFSTYLTAIIIHPIINYIYSMFKCRRKVRL